MTSSAGSKEGALGRGNSLSKKGRKYAVGQGKVLFGCSPEP